MYSHLPEPLAGLYSKAAELAGRPVVVDQLNNGQYIVMWMAFEASPPPAATDEAGALEKFISMMEAQKDSRNLPELSDIELKEIRGESVL